MSIWSQLLQELENFPRDVRELRVLPCVDPEELRGELESHYPFGAPVPLETLTAEVIRLLRAWTVHVTHPRYLASSTRGFGRPVLSLTHSWRFTIHSSPAGHTHQLPRIGTTDSASSANELGIDAHALYANFTTGGAEAQLSAVLGALALHFPESGETGLFAPLCRPAIYLTCETHHSLGNTR